MKSTIIMFREIGFRYFYAKENQIIFADGEELEGNENARIIFEFIASLEDFSQVFFISHRKESLKIMQQLKDNIIFYDVQDGMYTELD